MVLDHGNAPLNQVFKLGVKFHVLDLRKNWSGHYGHLQACLRYCARMALNFSIILSRGGQHSFITGSSEKLFIHADNSGNFSASTNFRSIISSRRLIKLAIHPKARSR